MIHLERKEKGSLSGLIATYSRWIKHFRVKGTATKLLEDKTGEYFNDLVIRKDLFHKTKIQC